MIPTTIDSTVTVELKEWLWSRMRESHGNGRNSIFFQTVQKSEHYHK